MPTGLGSLVADDARGPGSDCDRSLRPRRGGVLAPRPDGVCPSCRVRGSVAAGHVVPDSVGAPASPLVVVVVPCGAGSTFTRAGASGWGRGPGVLLRGCRGPAVAAGVVGTAAIIGVAAAATGGSGRPPRTCGPGANPRGAAAAPVPVGAAPCGARPRVGAPLAHPCDRRMPVGEGPVINLNATIATVGASGGLSVAVPAGGPGGRASKKS